MDIRSACCGTFQGFVTGVQYCKTGFYRNVLVIGADVGSVYGDLELSGEDVKKKDIVNAFLIGDGAGAVILRGFDENDEDIYGMEIEYTNIQSIGFGQEPGFWMPAGGWFELFSD